MEKEQRERLTKVAITGLAIALGSAALKKDIPEATRVKTVRYLEASKEVWVETIENGTMRATKLAAKVKNLLGDIFQPDNIEVLEDIELSEEQIVELEEAFPSSDSVQTNTLQNG